MDNQQSEKWSQYKHSKICYFTAPNMYQDVVNEIHEVDNNDVLWKTRNKQNIACGGK